MDLEELKRQDAELEKEIDRLRAALRDAQRRQREVRIEAAGVKVGDVVLAKFNTGETRIESVVRGFHALGPVGGTRKDWLIVSKRNKDGSFSKAERVAYHWGHIPDEAGQ